MTRPAGGYTAARAKQVRDGRMCKKCQRRWAQHGGLCRGCSLEAGEPRFNRWGRPAPSSRTVEPPAVVEPPLPRRTVVIDGVEYVITFDGT